MNLPNKLTFSRIIASIIFVALLSVDIPYSKLTATIVFLLACITDWFDGIIARKLNVETDFGKLMDPLADKILISSAFIVFVGLPEVSLPPWTVIIIIAREFAITGLRLLATNKGKVIPAGFWGKNKTISQIVAIISILVYLSAIEMSKITKSFEISKTSLTYFKYYIVLVMAITVVLTLISGIIYLYNSWHLLSDKD